MAAALEGNRVMAGKTKQLHEMTDENLLLALADTQKELFALRFRGTTEKLEAPTIKTVQRQRELSKLAAEAGAVVAVGS